MVTTDPAPGTPPDSPLDDAAELRARLERCFAKVNDVRQQTGEVLRRSRAVRARRQVAFGYRNEAEVLRNKVDVLREEVHGLRAALESRAVIEQAKGIVMAEHHCNADEAFDRLVQLSQHSHRKLRDVAGALVAATAQPAAQPNHRTGYDAVSLAARSEARTHPQTNAQTPPRTDSRSTPPRGSGRELS
jgi:hypothetical protein